MAKGGWRAFLAGIFRRSGSPRAPGAEPSGQPANGAPAPSGAVASPHRPARLPAAPRSPASREPVQLRDVLPNVNPATPARQRLVESMSELVALLQHAGELLEVQAKRQQQLADALADLPELVRLQRDQADHQADLTARLREAMDALSARLDAGDRTQARTAETLERLAEVLQNARRADASFVELMEQVRDHLTAGNQEIRDQLAASDRRLRWMLIVAIALSGGAIIAVIVLAALR